LCGARLGGLMDLGRILRVIENVPVKLPAEVELLPELAAAQAKSRRA